ncbi:MAG: hypothetical protein QOH21_960 [Acidobacteriota bacterium]|jgi:hypothetical protein|nr:hypothetical protein [Acidobacteriota bacterium]
MKLRLTVLPLLVLLTLPACAGLTPLKSPRNAVPPLDAKGVKRVMVVVLENGSPVVAAQQPFMKLLEGRGTRLDQYFGIAHPSQPNYIAIVAGNVSNAVMNDRLTLDRPHLGQVLGKRWKVYADDYPALPGKCNLTKSSGPYVRRHVPFLSFKDVQKSDCAQVVRLNSATDAIAALHADMNAGTLPDFGLIIPNLTHDGHAPSNIPNANRWLMENFAPLLDDPKFMDGTVFVLTFDEDETGDNKRGNRVYTVLAGPAVKQGVSRDVYNHYDLLATIATLLGVTPPPMTEADARPIGGIWK